MVAPTTTGTFVNSRCSTELAPDDDRHISVEAHHVQVLDEGRQGLVEWWNLLAAADEVVGVKIPRAKCNGHAPGTGHRPRPAGAPSGTGRARGDHRGGYRRRRSRRVAATHGRSGRERWDLRALHPELLPSGRRQKLKRLALNGVHDARHSHLSKNWFGSEP